MTHAVPVKSDQEAFEKVLTRLRNDVGTILRLIPEAKANNHWDESAPFWALVRMLFPIAESVGDLIHRQQSTVKNLTLVLENEFGAVRPAYKGKAAILTNLFRHSLTHTDEFRVLDGGARKVNWSISWDERPAHLLVTKKGGLRIKFDATAFYDDLVAVLTAARGKAWSNNVRNRYNGWLELKLNPKNTGHAAVLKEIAGL